MLPFITKYYWECTDCKNCIECNDPADEDKMLFCDCCDRGYHIYCVGLRKVPTGRWHCSVCAVCYSCGVTQPSPEDRMAEWHHEVSLKSHCISFMARIIFYSSHFTHFCISTFFSSERARRVQSFTYIVFVSLAINCIRRAISARAV